MTEMDFQYNCEVPSVTSMYLRVRDPVSLKMLDFFSQGPSLKARTSPGSRMHMNFVAQQTQTATYFMYNSGQEAQAHAIFAAGEGGQAWEPRSSIPESLLFSNYCD